VRTIGVDHGSVHAATGLTDDARTFPPLDGTLPKERVVDRFYDPITRLLKVITG
jgi:hypothetical protein